MKLKKSKYNIEIDKLDNGNILLYNSFSNAFGIMDKTTQEIYYKIESIDEDKITQDDLRKGLSTLKENKFIVDANLDEYKLVMFNELTNKFSKDSFGLAIAPTLNCNMACNYCFEDKKNIFMNEDIINQLIEFTNKKIKNVSHFKVTWYGGEPLLEKEILRNLSNKFITMCNNKNIDYKAYIITNGTLLDYDTAVMLKEECKISCAQITIDGMKDINDKRRFLKNKQSSFDIIMKNIDAIKDYLPIIIRINIDKSNIKSVEEFIDYIIDIKGWVGKVAFYFAPVFANTESCKHVVNRCYTNKEFATINSDLLKKVYQKGCFNNIVRYYPRYRPIPCGAITINNYAVDPNGNLYKCWNVIGDKNYSIGNLATGESNICKTLDWIMMEKPDKCKECAYLPICETGCPYDTMLNKNPICLYNTFNIKENLKIFYQEYLKRKIG